MHSITLFVNSGTVYSNEINFIGDDNPFKTSVSKPSTSILIKSGLPYCAIKISKVVI